MITRSRGFTLIELLVVIAIIGILSSVVLASLNSARNKGADAAIRSNLANARAQAEVFYTDNGNRYVGTVGTASDVCYISALAGTTEGIYNFAKAAADRSGVALQYTLSPVTAGLAKCHATPVAASGYNPLTGGWAIEVPLKATYTGIATPFYCVDNTGFVGIVNGSTLAANDAACN